MSIFLNLLKALVVSVAAVGSFANAATDTLKSYIGEMHPPVIVDVGDKKIGVFFLRNNKKSVIATHVSEGEVFYFQFEPVKSKLNYVSKLEGREIISVFTYSHPVGGADEQFIYVLTKTPVFDSSRKGSYYSTIKFSVVSDSQEARLIFFENDFHDPRLGVCFEGIHASTDDITNCAYKDEASIRAYLTGRGL